MLSHEFESTTSIAPASKALLILIMAGLEDSEQRRRRRGATRTYATIAGAVHHGLARTTWLPVRGAIIWIRRRSEPDGHRRFRASKRSRPGGRPDRRWAAPGVRSQQVEEAPAASGGRSHRRLRYDRSRRPG